ncbi:MAG: hypothetical protein Q4A84_09530 [Neisseria sp.]|uniref:hypothetical protein n=1 Tax=Neisseria sp. TaxID=192066 RepID=UPI0026DDA17C|nr:hypothetical protein [Neisseria sp.]MDO4641918.1 hypothetical protein [Neisseria sp.]
MKKSSKAVALTGILALFSSSAFAAAPIPHEIYNPTDAQVVKAEHSNGGEFEAEFLLKSKHTSVKSLARQVRQHAKRQGFHEIESSVENNDADLKFKRKDQELDVSIERKDHGIIEYKADLDLDKN